MTKVRLDSKLSSDKENRNSLYEPFLQFTNINTYYIVSILHISHTTKTYTCVGLDLINITHAIIRNVSVREVITLVNNISTKVTTNRRKRIEDIPTRDEHIGYLSSVNQVPLNSRVHQCLQLEYAKNDNVFAHLFNQIYS